MGNRGADTNPVGINDVFRVDQGWLDVVEIDKGTNATYTTEPDAPAYRFINSAKSGEFFLWSNVQPTQEWVSLKGGGILLWHYDNSISGNNPPATLQLAVVQGGGSRILSATTWPDPGSAATDLFYKGNNSEISGTTKPASTWNGGAASGLRIYDISAKGAQMTFSVGTGVPVDGGAVVVRDAGQDVAPDAAKDGNVIRDARADLPGAGGTMATGGALASGGTTGSAGATAGAVTSGGTKTGGAVSSGGAVASAGAVTSGGSSSKTSSANGGSSAGTTGAKGGETASSGSAAGGASSSASASSTAASSKSGCSCSLGRPTNPTPLAGLLLLLAAWARARRRH
jgi:MYXO-CTERM domain-containing protein